VATEHVRDASRLIFVAWARTGTRATSEAGPFADTGPADDRVDRVDAGHVGHVDRDLRYHVDGTASKAVRSRHSRRKSSCR